MHLSLKVLLQKKVDGIIIVGFDNSIIATCTTPQLTSIDNKVEALSLSAARLLLDVLEGKNVPQKTVITPEIVIRETANL